MEITARNEAARQTFSIQDDIRFAELAARTGLEPALARRCADDPVAVLAEFGLAAAESLYMGTTAVNDEVALLAQFGISAAEPMYMGSMAIEDLDRAGSGAIAKSCGLGCGAAYPVLPTREAAAVGL